MHNDIFEIPINLDGPWNVLKKILDCIKDTWNRKPIWKLISQNIQKFIRSGSKGQWQLYLPTQSDNLITTDVIHHSSRTKLRFLKSAGLPLDRLKAKRKILPFLTSLTSHISMYEYVTNPGTGGAFIIHFLILNP